MRALGATYDVHLRLIGDFLLVFVELISGFNQRQGEALPPQIFLTFKFVVWAKG